MENTEKMAAFRADSVNSVRSVYKIRVYACTKRMHGVGNPSSDMANRNVFCPCS